MQMSTSSKHLIDFGYDNDVYTITNMSKIFAILGEIIIVKQQGSKAFSQIEGLKAPGHDEKFCRLYKFDVIRSNYSKPTLGWVFKGYMSLENLMHIRPDTMFDSYGVGYF